MTTVWRNKYKSVCVCVCVCVSVCLSTTILALQAAKRHQSDTNSSSATSARKLNKAILLKRRRVTGIVEDYIVWRSHTLSQKEERVLSAKHQRLVQNNRNPVISNQIAERPIRDILGLRDVTLSWNVQSQHDKDKTFAELYSWARSYIAGPLCFVGALVFNFGKLLSHFFLVVGRETHGLLC